MVEPQSHIQNKKKIKSFGSRSLDRPFLSWTGSKRWFIKSHVEEFLPLSFNNYHEPFLGSGAMFFYLRNSRFHDEKKNYFLSDSNEDLINAFQQLKSAPEKVIKRLKTYKNTEEDYYEIRKIKSSSKVIQAARFIFLNKTSFNGIYRVNTKGEYNVPFGKRLNVDFVTEELLHSVSMKLQNATILTNHFENCLENIEKGDLVFLDPPYTVAHENNGFIEYNKKLFKWEDQESLKLLIEKIIEKEAYFILTNASHYSISELYQNVGKTFKLSRYSQVGGKQSSRGNFNELVICNTK